MHPMEAGCMSTAWPAISGKVMSLLNKRKVQASTSKEHRDMFKRWLPDDEELSAGMITFDVALVCILCIREVSTQF